jgi:hypothetical protein
VTRESSTSSDGLVKTGRRRAGRRSALLRWAVMQSVPMDSWLPDILLAFFRISSGSLARLVYAAWASAVTAACGFMCMPRCARHVWG